MLGGLFGRSLWCWVSLCPWCRGRFAGTSGWRGMKTSHILRSGMFGYIPGPVTTVQCRAERAEHRRRKQASNLHRPRVFVQDRMVAWMIDRLRAGGTPPDDRREVSDRGPKRDPRMWVICDTIYQWIYRPGPAPPSVVAVSAPCVRDTGHHQPGYAPCGGICPVCTRYRRKLRGRLGAF